MRDYPRFDYVSVKVTKYQKVFAPSTVYRELLLVIGELLKKLPVNWAPGMVGLVPVFDTIENAEKFAEANGAEGRQITGFIIPVGEENEEFDG